MLLAGCGGGAGPDRADPAGDGASRAGIDIPPATAARAPARDRYAKPLGFAVQYDASREDPAYLRDWVRNATSVTPENALKWEVVEPQPGRFDFATADAIIDAATQTGKRVRGHPLLWDQQLPAWVANRPWTADTLAEALRNHVTTIVRRYKGRVAVWDVVNEPLEDDGSMTPSVFRRVLGERYIDIAFEAAHAADPDARLFLNEIGADKGGPKQNAILDLAGRLKARGVPIDGLGLQNHAVVDDFPTKESWDGTIEAVAAKGLDFEITEMDVALRTPGALDTATAGAQAQAYRAAALACRRHDACTGLTVWGVTDRWSWQGPDKHPLPFDDTGAPKPAWTALRAALVAQK